jgi:hypothetical protein
MGACEQVEKAVLAVLVLIPANQHQHHKDFTEGTFQFCSAFYKYDEGKAWQERNLNET